MLLSRVVTIESLLLSLGANQDSECKDGPYEKYTNGYSSKHEIDHVKEIAGEWGEGLSARLR